MEKFLNAFANSNLFSENLWKMLYKAGLSYLNSYNSEPEQSNKVMAFRLTFLTATTITIKALSVVCIEFAKRKFLIRTIFSFL